MSDIRSAYEKAKTNMGESAIMVGRRDDAVARWYTDVEIADAMLYGDGLIHMNPDARRILQKHRYPASEEYLHMAVMRLFHATGHTVIKVDDVLKVATEHNALTL
jgi:hypothetical protein